MSEAYARQHSEPANEYEQGTDAMNVGHRFPRGAAGFGAAVGGMNSNATDNNEHHGDADDV